MKLIKEIMSLKEFKHSDESPDVDESPRADEPEESSADKSRRIFYVEIEMEGDEQHLEDVIAGVAAEFRAAAEKHSDKSGVEIISVEVVDNIADDEEQAIVDLDNYDALPDDSEDEPADDE